MEGHNSKVKETTKTAPTQTPTTTPSLLKKNAKDFDDKSFWKKICQAASSIGKKAVYLALVLYYTATDSSTPYDKRLIIWGALAYLVLPIDLIPDFLPGGYADDSAALTTAFLTVKSYVTPAIEQKAKDKLACCF